MARTEHMTCPACAGRLCAKFDRCLTKAPKEDWIENEWFCIS